MHAIPSDQSDTETHDCGMHPGAAPGQVMSKSIDPIIDVHITPSDLHAALSADVVAGLTAVPKELPPKWFYDERGSQLFDEITRLDEYYPTAAEREILRREADVIIDLAGPHSIIELGSGTSDKTQALLEAGRADGRLERFIPFDVSERFLTDSAVRLVRRYPGLVVHGVVGDFDRHLAEIPDGGRRLIMMLGSTIGNYRPAERAELLVNITARMRPGDHLLLGTDMVKAIDRVELAYNDPAGVTDEFNLNILEVINRELGGRFDLSAFEHVARYDDHHEWIEMFLRSKRAQVIHIGDLDLDVSFDGGEMMRTEISAKFRRPRIEAELAVAGLRVVRWWTDGRRDFSVSLSTQSDASHRPELRKR